MLQSMGSQRVRYNLATERQQQAVREKWVSGVCVCVCVCVCVLRADIMEETAAPSPCPTPTHPAD